MLYEFVIVPLVLFFSLCVSLQFLFYFILTFASLLTMSTWKLIFALEWEASLAFVKMIRNETNFFSDCIRQTIRNS